MFIRIGVHNYVCANVRVCCVCVCVCVCVCMCVCACLCVCACKCDWGKVRSMEKVKAM